MSTRTLQVLQYPSKQQNVMVCYLPHLQCQASHHASEAISKYRSYCYDEPPSAMVFSNDDQVHLHLPSQLSAVHKFLHSLAYKLVSMLTHL